MEDALGFAQGTLGDTRAAGDLLNLREGAGLLQAIEAGQDGVEEVEQEQGGVLVEEEFAVAGLVAGGAVVVQASQQGSDEGKILEALEVFGGNGWRRLAG